MFQNNRTILSRLNMILRRNFLPHILPDISATLFLSVCVAITFWFELFVVVPEFHAPGSLAYNLTFAAAVFLLLNVKGNMLAVMLIDTSIKGTYAYHNPTFILSQIKLFF